VSAHSTSLESLAPVQVGTARSRAADEIVARLSRFGSAVAGQRVLEEISA
jgi:hypothetical protein